MKLGKSPWRLAGASLALCTSVLRASASPSSASLSGSSLFRPLVANSSLFALHADNATDAADTAANWHAFERFLLSHTRASPVVLLFTESEAADGVYPLCEALASDQSEREWGEDALFPPEEPAADEVTRPVTECLERAQRHELAMHAASVTAQARSKPWDPIVVVPRDKLPQAFRYHRVEVTPSMLWLPPRVARGFQRFPLAGDNFLDLSTASSPLSPRRFHSVDALEADVSDFVYQCHVRSGYRSGKALRTATVPSRESGGPSVFHLVTALALAVLAILAISEHRDAMLAVLQMRSLWFFLSLGVVYVSLSGVFFTIIHRVGPLHFSAQHGIVFVYPSSRRQFALEGMFHGGWSLAVSLAALAITEVLPRLRATARDDLLRASLLGIAISYTIVYFTFLSKYQWMAMP